MTFSYGWKPSPPDHRDIQLKVRKPLLGLPKTVDLRTSGFMPPVYDQLDLGSCTANAAASALDFERKRQGEALLNPSRLFIYYNERKDDGDVRTDGGSTLREAAKAIKSYGAVPEPQWPYIPAKFTIKPPTKLYQEAVSYESLLYSAVDANDLKTCLAGGATFIGGITVYQSFESDAIAATGIVPMPRKDEQAVGGHALNFVGYKTLGKTDYFIVKNSWGTSWGDAGFCYIPVAYIINPNLAGDFWTLSKVK